MWIRVDPFEKIDCFRNIGRSLDTSSMYNTHFRKCNIVVYELLTGINQSNLGGFNADEFGTVPRPEKGPPQF
jgi:hypothetical protein